MSDQIEALIEMAKAQGRSADAVSELAAAVRESTGTFAAYADKNEDEHDEIKAELGKLRDATETTQTALASALFEVSDTLKAKDRPKVARLADWVVAHPAPAAAMATFLAVVLFWVYLVVRDANPDNLHALRDAAHEVAPEPAPEEAP